MAQFEPEPIPASKDPAVVLNYVYLQFQLLSIVLEGVENVKLFERHVEPFRKDTGTIVLADGTDWDPGSGRGFYGWDGTTWFYLG